MTDQLLSTSKIYTLFLFIINSLIIIFQPIIGSILFILFLVMTDFLLGSIAALKNKKFKSEKSIRKLYVLVAYMTAIIIARVFEHYFSVGELLFVKAVTVIIAASEIQSVREKIQMITGVDVFKHLVRFMQKKEDDLNNE